MAGSGQFYVDPHRIKVTGTLDPLPLVANGRWRLAILNKDAALTSGTVGIYSDSDSLAAHVGLTANALAAGIVALANGAPDVAIIDWLDSDTVTDALDAACGNGLVWYWTGAAVPASDATTDEIDDWIFANASTEVGRKQQIAKVETVAEWTGAPPQSPAGWTTIGTRKRTSALAYKVTTPATPLATEWPEFAIMGKFSGIDPSERSMSGTGSISGTGVGGLTKTEGENAIANGANVAELNRALNPKQVTFYDGDTYSSERITAMVSLDWTAWDMEDRLSNYFSRLDQTSLKLGGDIQGAASVEAILEPTGTNGLAVGHFTRNSVVPQGYSFDAAYNNTSGCFDVTATFGYLDAAKCVSVSYRLVREA